MEKKEFREQKHLLIKQINDLKTQVKILEEKQIAESATIPIGTKVRIKADGRIGFVTSYYIGLLDDVCIKLNKCKNDGSMSGHSMGVYELKTDEVEVVDE